MKSRIEIDAYFKGFYDGAMTDPRNPTTIMVAGYSFDQILNLVLKDQEEKAMNRILKRKEALAYCQSEGYKLFIDVLIKDRCVVWEDEPERLVIDHVDKGPIIIKRNGKIIYEE